MTRGQQGRELARAELALGVGVGVVAALLWFGAPGYMGGPPPDWQRFAFLALPGAGLLIGITWMIRIYRADPEPDQHLWRYRARD